MEKTVFDFADYKEFLKYHLSSSWGEVSKLAKSAGCQRSYLSRVLNEHVHLTPDHGYGVCAHFKLSIMETEYFMLLLELARSGSKEYRIHLEKKLQSLRREQENIAKRLNRMQITPGETESTYYSAWYWSAIHIATSVRELQTPESIAKHFQLPEALVRLVLEKLKYHGLIQGASGRWKYGKGEVHIPRTSPLVSLHHQNWRERAAINSRLMDPESVHFTVVQSMDRKAYDEIKRLVLEIVESSSQIAGPAPCEEVVCFNIDLFRV
jgi:hypothetical protein